VLRLKYSDALKDGARGIAFICLSLFTHTGFLSHLVQDMPELGGLQVVAGGSQHAVNIAEMPVAAFSPVATIFRALMIAQRVCMGLTTNN